MAGYVEVATTKLAAGGTRVENLSTGTGSAGGVGTGLAFPNRPGVRLYINNTAANTPNVIIEARGVFKGAVLTTTNDETIALAASAQYIVGNLDPEIYNDPDDGNVYLNFTGGNETDVEVVAVEG